MWAKLNSDKDTIEEIISKPKEMIIDDNMVNLGPVLDLGCGTGLIGFELKPFSKNIDGVDLSKFMLV